MGNYLEHTDLKRLINFSLYVFLCAAAYFTSAYEKSLQKVIKLEKKIIEAERNKKNANFRFMKKFFLLFDDYLTILGNKVNKMQISESKKKKLPLKAVRDYYMKQTTHQFWSKHSNGCSLQSTCWEGKIDLNTASSQG